MQHISWGFVLAGFGSLLVSSYYDNIRGPLIPAVAADLGLAFAESGWFLAVSQAVATAATLSLMRALNIWSERTVMLAVVGVGIATALAAPLVAGTASLMALAAMIGCTLSPLGTMANVLIVEGAPAAHTGRYLSGLHAMFGIGAMLATGAVGFGVARGWHWSLFYLAGLPLLTGLGVWAAVRLKRHGPHGAVTVQSARLTRPQILVVLTFAVYVAGEVTGGAWMTSFLVSHRGFALAAAAPYVTGYFLVMTVTRLASAALATPAREPALLKAALLLPLAAYAVGFRGPAWVLSLVGLYGPFFPLFLARASRAFPATWRSMTIWTIVAMNVALGLASVGVGALADRAGIAAAYSLAALLLAAAFGLLLVCLRRLPEG